MKSLKDTIDNRQLFEAYPMAFLEQYQDVKTEDNFIGLLYEIVHRIHSLDERVVSGIDEKGLTDVKFFLTDMLYELTNKDK